MARKSSMLNNTNMNELIAYFQQMEERLTALETAVQALSEQLAEQLTTTSAQTKQFTSLQNDMVSLQEQLAAYQEANAELEGRMDELESRSEFVLPEEDNFEEEPEEEEPEEDMDELEGEPEPEEETSNEGLPIVEASEDLRSTSEAPKAEPAASIVPKVSDIKKAISLGDRFLFQRELFGGNGELMAKTIADLNKMNSLDEADAYIKAHFNWAEDSNAYELFYNILKRRW